MVDVTRYARRIEQPVVDAEATRVPLKHSLDVRREQLGLIQRSLRAAVREQRTPGLFVFVAAAGLGHVGRLWLAATPTPRAGLIGRHAQVDLQLSFDGALSLRQAMFIVRLRDGRARFTVLDLDTPSGLVSSADTPVHLLESEHLLSFRTGAFSFFCVPTGPGCDVPENVEEAWLRFDAPAPRREASWLQRLLRREESTAKGLLTVHARGVAETFPVGEEALARGVLIGRSERCHPRIPDNRVSRVHAVLISIDGAPHLIDAGSTNGLWCGDHEVRCQPLREEERFRLGSASLRWSRAP